MPDPTGDDLPEHRQFDPADALALIETESARVRRSLDAHLPLPLLAWGLAWLIGFGALWFDVRSQDPFTGPGTVAAVLFAVLLVAAAVVTAVATSRATRGRGGVTARRARDLGLFWGLGFLAVLLLAAGIARVGIPPQAAALLFSGGSVVVTGLAYLATAATFGGTVEKVLGAWLLVVVGGGVWTGPTTLMALIAVAGGGAFLLAALVQARRSRSVAHHG